MAFVQKQLVQLSMQGGLQSKVDELQLQPNNLLVLENARFSKQGAVNKRPGFDQATRQIMGAGYRENCDALNVYNEELLTFDGNYVYTYNDDATNPTWISRGTAISVINSTRQILRLNTAQQLNPDGVYCNGYECYTWQDSRGGARYSIVRADTGAFIVSDKLIFDFGGDETVIRPKVITSTTQDLFYLFYTDGYIIFNQIINTTTPLLISNPTRVILNGDSANLLYDVCNFNDILTDYPIYIYNAVDGVDILINQGTTINIWPVAADCMTITQDSLGDIWCFFAVGLAIYAYACRFDGTPLSGFASAPLNVYNVDPTKALSIATITAVETLQFSGTMIATYEVHAAVPVGLKNSNNWIGTFTLNANASSSASHGPNVITGFTNGTTLQRIGLASKAFSYNRNTFVNAAFQSDNQSTYYTICTSRNPMTVIGKINPNLGGGYRSNHMLAECSEYQTVGKFLLAMNKKGIFQVDNNQSFTELGVAAEFIDFTHPNNFSTVTSSNNMILAGGVVQMYDGVSVTEFNYNWYVESFGAIASAGVSGLSGGEYQYSIVEEWSDNWGQIQYSAPSIPFTITVNPGDTVALTIPTLGLTAKTAANGRAEVAMTIYRTAVNGIIFYKIGAVNNDTTGPYVYYTDSAADSSITSNAPLYSETQLANSSPPSCTLISYFQDRVMLSGLEDPNVIWYSQENSNLTNFNVLPVQFSDLLTVGVDPYGGSGNGSGTISALSWMDDNGIIFKEKTIYILSGQGPDANGNGSFNTPGALQSDVGCNNQQSICSTYDGILFKSDKGIYQLSRSNQPTYIGAPVESFNSNTITSSQLLADTNEVIFTTTDGNLLVYNYYFQTWSVWPNLPAVDSVIWNGNLVLGQKDGTILIQNPTSFADDLITGKSYISMKVVTPWITLSGMQGYQSVFRMFLLGSLKGDHFLNIGVSYDYNDSVVENAQVNSNVVSANLWGGLPLWGDGIWGLGGWAPYQFQYNFAKQKCQSIKLTIYDSETPLVLHIDPAYETGGITEGYALSALTFEIGMLPDGIGLPLGNKVGGFPISG